MSTKAHSFLCLVVGEPVREGAEYNDPKRVYFHTIKERLEFADRHGDRSIPLPPTVMEHAGGELAPDSEHFPVPSRACNGRMVDTMVRSTGEFLHVIELFYEHQDDIQMIANDLKNGIPWGGSLGKDLLIDEAKHEIVSKEISHLGLTRMPLHGDAKVGPTWITVAADNPQAFYKALREFLRTEPGTYVPPGMQERLDRLWAMEPSVATTEVPKETKQEEVVVDAMQGVEIIPLESQSEVAQPLASPLPTPPSPSNIEIRPSLFDLSSQFSSIFTQPRSFVESPLVTMATSETTPPASQPSTAPTQSQPPTSDDTVRLAAFKNFFDKLSTLAQKLTPDPNTNKPPVDWDRFRAASELQGETNSLMKGMDASSVPLQLWRSQAYLQDYIDLVNKEVEPFYKQMAEQDSELVVKQREAMQNPLTAQNLPVAQTVLSSFKSGLKNADTWQASFNKERADKMEVEARLKRDRETWEKKEAELTEREAKLKAELEQNKRARVEQPPSTSSSSSFAPGAPPPSILSGGGNFQITGLKELSVGASLNPLGLPPGMRLVERTKDPRHEKFLGTNLNKDFNKIVMTTRFGDWAQRSSMFANKKD